MDNCLFCKIIAGEIPSSKVYEDECVYAFTYSRVGVFEIGNIRFDFFSGKSFNEIFEIVDFIEQFS